MTKWKSKRIREIITKLNNYIFGTAQTATINADHEDLSEAISRAMAALDVDSDDTSVDVPAYGAPDNVIAAAEEPTFVLQTIESISGVSALSNFDKGKTDTDGTVQGLTKASGGS